MPSRQGNTACTARKLRLATKRYAATHVALHGRSIFSTPDAAPVIAIDLPDRHRQGRPLIKITSRDPAVVVATQHLHG